jgi:hypothetical protein
VRHPARGPHPKTTCSQAAHYSPHTLPLLPTFACSYLSHCNLMEALLANGRCCILAQLSAGVSTRRGQQQDLQRIRRCREQSAHIASDAAITGMVAVAYLCNSMLRISACCEHGRNRHMTGGMCVTHGVC